MAKLLVLFIRALHYLIVAFNLFAWLCSDSLVLKIHLWFIPLMILQWKLNRNACVLTNLEQVLLGKPARGQEEESQFIKSMLAHCLRSLPSDEVIEKGTYIILAVVWGLSFMHLNVLYS
ncbi:MAG: DUF2784 family protein [Bdellovibrionales bacterium]|nr:DUF2784 family protein [Bdellovibrionales bacterium]